MKTKAKRLDLVPLIILSLIGLLLGPEPARAAPPPSGAWWGDYFDNPFLSGGPVASRYDEEINFYWGTSSPASGVPTDNFSVRWVRDAWFAAGTYRFSVISDDGVRVWVGDQLVVDEWHECWGDPIYVDRYIPAGTYRVRVEYFEYGGDATISVGWGQVVGGTAWHGEYFDNRKLDGTAKLVRGDSAIDFDWGGGSPDPSLPADDFSVRWTRTLGFNAGTYRFLTSTDDGVRVWVGGELIVDAWDDQALPNTHSGDVYLAAGQHAVIVEYYEHGGEASAHVWWRSLDAFSGWRGEYFDNPDLVGGPALVRDDAEISFDWGIGPPADWMPDDNFSVRWTRTIDFAPGHYRFSVQSDDGARVWIDHATIIDKWRDSDYELHYISTHLEGPHTVKLEYFEHTGHARVRFWWEPDPGAVPAPAPAPAEDAGAWADDPWTAVYFPNTDLSGEPALTRIETALDHNWGWGSPGAGVPSDGFSARWTQPLYFRAGSYRFTTYTDDGVRLWVDGRLLIDAWQPMRGYRSATVWLSEGVHDVRMAYYERSGVALARLTWACVSR